MLSLSLPSVGPITLDASNFLTAHPHLIYDVAGHALAHSLYSHLRQHRGRGMSRRQLRKALTRKRRWFVDNIIMHHRRLHERNRKTIVNNARARVLARLKDEKKRELTQIQPTVERSAESVKWRNAVSLREKGSEIRGRIDSRRARARSRWLTVEPK